MPHLTGTRHPVLRPQRWRRKLGWNPVLSVEAPAPRRTAPPATGRL